MHWGCDEADIVIQYMRFIRNAAKWPPRVRLESDFALQAMVECRALEPERVVRLVLLRRQSNGGLTVGLQKKKTQKLCEVQKFAVHAGGCA